MDGIALELYTLKKKVLVFSKPQIFFKKIETLSSYPDRALLGQLEEAKEEVSGNGAGLRGGCKGIPLAEPSHVGGAAGAAACTCVLRVCTHSPLSLAGLPEPLPRPALSLCVPYVLVCPVLDSTWDLRVGPFLSHPLTHAAVDVLLPIPGRFKPDGRRSHPARRSPNVS